MYDLDELYQQVVMEHSRHPRNLKKLDSANRSADGFNPFCGDKIALYLEVDDQEVIRDVGIQATGCAISKAAASMMTEAIKGKTTEEAREIFDAYRHLLTNSSGEEVDVELLGDLDDGPESGRLGDGDVAGHSCLHHAVPPSRVLNPNGSGRPFP